MIRNGSGLARRQGVVETGGEIHVVDRGSPLLNGISTGSNKGSQPGTGSGNVPVVGKGVDHIEILKRSGIGGREGHFQF